MRYHRTTARGALLLLAALTVTGLAGAAPKPGLVDGKPIVYPLLGGFPVDDNYGDPRGNGRHAGIDTEAPRLTPVLAAEDGKVTWWTTSARAGCMLYLHGKSGTTYLYIHLNNDLTDRSEDKGGCVLGVAYTVKNGARVTAGQQIALNGDSGDAEGNPHLHFEVHPNDGADVNPYPYLVAATRTLFPARVGQRFTLGVRGIPLSAGAGELEVSVTSVRWWPGGRWTSVTRRTVTFGVPVGTTVDTALARLVQSPERRTLASARAASVTVFTKTSKATPESLRAEPGTLAARRVVRPGATTVVIGSGADETPDDGTWEPPWEDDTSAGDETAASSDRNR